MEKTDFSIPPLSINSLKSLRRLTLKKYRDREGLYIIEGLRLCKQAILAGAQLEQLLVTTEFQNNPELDFFQRHANTNKISIFSASDSDFSSLVETENPQGIAAVVEKQTYNLESITRTLNGVFLAIDRIQDPGNLGTIIRTAEWFGTKAIICSAGTVDYYNPKVLRSAMGASFSIPIFQDINLISVIKSLKEKKFNILGTSSKTGMLPQSLPPQDKTLFLVGSEAHGLDPSLLPFIDKTICIPGEGHSESLNAAIATGIILYELFRKK
jgi:RNA methyltransferase, TrmH family